MTFKSLTTLVICAFVLLVAASWVGARNIEIGTDTAILDDLKTGGFIIYFRHGEATVGQDQPELNLEDCRTQRNLSSHGKEQAQALKEALKENPFPVHFPVISDPYCRAKDTADMIFGKENVTVYPRLASIEKLKIEGLPTAEKQQILADLTKIFETTPARGTNTVIVAHTFPPHVALGEIPNLGAVIIKPKGSGNGYEVVGKVTSEELIRWSNKTSSNIESS